ncbi:phosphate/phosphite/phosphonate ABC transporter substrate-binding protein [Neptuniibacter sp. QD37_6]|uniref:phosphate/phosphite/phosphonate ABC transporter substrate-binding protein n=1 Tax=Neptuniibacter sp. QD37_6 TaxID=3398210 RepID=UPI0039F613F3
MLLNRRLFTFLFVFTLACPSVSVAKTFTVGVVPQFDIKTIYSIWQPILDVLEEKTGHKYVLKGSKDIPTFEKDFSMGAFDFAYMNPYHYTISEHYKPIARDHGRKLFGILVVNRDEGIQNIQQLEGQTLVFPAPNALGASLMIRSELEQKYGINFTPKFVNTHSSVYLNVVLNLAPAGGGVQKTFNQQQSDIKEKLNILLKTESVQPHPLTAKLDLDSDIVESVTEALLQMGKDENHQKLLAKVPFKKIGAASDRDYDQVRKLNLERYYVSPK